jgi:rhamnosyltransferase
MKIDMNQTNPFVSIVYLTRNGGHVFEKSLAAVFSQKVNFDFEVIVVDSESTDGTLEVLERYPIRVYKVTRDEFNFGLTRDYGFSLAKGVELVAISQDAVPVGPDWLKNMISPFANSSIMVVQGMEIVPADQNIFFWEKYRLFYYTRESRRWLKSNNNIGLSFTCCAIRRMAWQENPLGWAEMSEDKLFQRRISAKGYNIFLQREAKYYHAHMYNDISSLAKRCENEGLGWRIAGQRYSFPDLIMDIINPLMLAVLVYGLLTLQIRHWSELLFPLIRPTFVFKGNNFTKQYVK